MTLATILRIAHGYGNISRAIERALKGPVDAIEADLWYRASQIWVRHEARLPLLPILWAKRSNHNVFFKRPGLRLGCWHIGLDLQPLRLEELLAQVDGRCQLLFDLKGRYSPPHVQSFARRLVNSVQRFGIEDIIHVCGGWVVLDEVRRVASELRVHYSVGDSAQWRALLLRIEKGDLIKAICIHRSLLDEDRARFLHENAIEFYCWAVEDASDARRLMALGARGIISFDLHLLGSL